MPKITKRFVDAVEVDPERQQFFWDDEVSGFGLRVTPGGATSFVLDYRTRAGQRRRLTLGRFGPLTVERARAKAISMLGRIVDGADPAAERETEREILTVNQLADLYLAEGPAMKATKAKRSWDTDTSNLRAHIRPLLGKKLAKVLTATDISRFQQDVADGKTHKDEKTKARGRAIVEGGQGIAARCVRVISAMYSFAIAQKLVEVNPCLGVKLFKPRKMERFLSIAELERLGDALREAERVAVNGRMIAAIRLLLLTGCRKEEILGLRWDWVDLERRRLSLPVSKTGAKNVPLGAPAADILSHLWNEREGDAAWVFPATRGDGHIVGLQKIWAGVRTNANLPGVRIHDLRHSFASVAVAGGDSLFLVGKVLGHRQSRTTEGYAHLADDPLHMVAERTSTKIAVAMRLQGASTDETPSS
ncbi:MAG: site-specific integrase [Aliidongia sp.]